MNTVEEKFQEGEREKKKNIKNSLCSGGKEKKKTVTALVYI